MGNHCHTWTQLYVGDGTPRTTLPIAMNSLERYKRCDCGAVGIEIGYGRTVKRLDEIDAARHMEEAKKYNA